MGMAKNKATGRAVKHTNKRLNKLARKGKLRRKTQDKLRAIKEERSKDNIKKLETIEDDWNEYKAVLEEEDALPDDMLDQDLPNHLPPSLVKLESTEVKPKKRGRVEEVDFCDPERHFIDPEYGLKKMKMLLPIKDSDGSLKPQFMEIADVKLEPEDVEEVDEDLEKKIESQNRWKNMTASEILAERHKIIKDTKRKVANYSSLLLEDPQEHIHRIKELLWLSFGKDVDGIVRESVKKLATVSLAQVFIDIIPNYQIKPTSSQEMKLKLKKETKVLYEFEDSLLRYYNKFIKHLQKIAMSKRGDEMDQLARISIKCMCKLLTSQPQFNYRDNLIDFILKYTTETMDESIVADCCNAIKEIMDSDKLGEISLDCVRAINRLVKERINKVKPCVLQIILQLRIREVNNKTAYSESRTEKKRSKLIALSKKDKKYAKQLGKLENELKEAKAFEDKNTVLRLNTQIMEQVFVMYFRLLKKTVKPRLLPPVLEGLSKFAHLINVQLFDELLATIHSMMIEKNLNILDSLHCIHTAMVILSGEGHVLTIDPCKFYKALYSLIPKIMTEQRNEIRDKQFVLALKCLDMMLNKRRKQISKSRVAAFVKRLVLFCLILPPKMQMTVLLAIRTYFLAHPSLTNMTETEVHGSGKYLSALKDPDHCNAQCTNICQELDVLKKSSQINVSRIANHLNEALPSIGPHKLPTELTERNPAEYYADQNVQQSIPPLKELLKNWSHIKDLKSLLESMKPVNK